MGPERGVLPAAGHVSGHGGHHQRHQRPGHGAGDHRGTGGLQRAGVDDPSHRQQQVSRAQQILHANQGAVERHIVLIDRYLKLKNSQSESIIAESIS